MRKREKIFYTYFFSYIIISFFPLIISLLGYHICEKMIEEEICITQENVLVQLRNSFDNSIEGISLDGKMLGSNQNLHFLANEKRLTTDDRIKIKELRDEIALQKGRSDLCSEIVVFFQENGTILTDQKVYDHSISDLYYTEGDNAKESIEKALQLSGIRGYMVGNDREGNKNLLFIENIYNYNYKNKIAVIILTIPWNSVQERFNGIGGGNIYWVNSSEEYLLLNETDNQGVWLPYETFENEGELIYSEDKEISVVSSFSKSQFSDWKYCITMPQKYYFGKLHKLHIFIMAETGGLIVFAILMALYYSYQNYRPIARIIAQIKQNQKDASKSIAFHDIEDYLKKLHSENQKLNASWKKVKDSASREIIAGYLKGWNTDSNLLQETVRTISDVDLSGGYVIALIVFNDINQCKLFEDTDEIHNPETKELLRFIFYNIFSETILSRYKGFLINMENMYFCALQISSQDEFEKSVEDMKKCAQIYLERMNLNIFVAVSGFHSGIEEIQKAYNETVQVISYQTFWGTTNELLAIYENTYNIHMASDEEILLAEAQKKLYQLMLSQKYEEAKRMLTEIMDRIFIRDISYTEVNQCRLFGMLNNICMFLIDILGKKDEEFIYELHPMERLLKAKNINEAKENLQLIFDEIILHLKTSLTEDRPTWINDILQIVERDYDNVNLNVSMLAEKINMNLAYVGRTFKQYMGVGLSDYIHSVRIRECKKLLEEGASVTAAAEKVGYVDAKSLIRIFKKQEGITPGQYKINTEIHTYKKKNP